MWLLIGSLAATLTMFAFIPQIFKVLKTKSVKDISLFTLLQFALGVSLWIIYGIHIKDAIIIIANLITAISLIILLCIYFNYRRIEK